MISKRNAFAIAHKLGAEIREGGKHHLVVIRHDGQTVAQYGISRGGSEKNQRHVPKQLKVSNAQAAALVRCSLGKNDYFGILRDKGLLG